MTPQLLALLTAMAWGIGGYFEKKALTMMVLGGEPLTWKIALGTLLTIGEIVALTM